MTVTIYALCHPRTGEIRYVGKCVDPLARLKSHLYCGKNTHRRNWIKALKDEGLRPVMEILEVVESIEWQEAERFWISYLRFIGCKLTNLSPGGIGGEQHSIETRRKMSKTRTGMVRPSDIGAKISKSLTGKRFTEEHRRHLSESHKGQKPSQAGLLKRRAKVIGVKRPQMTIAKIAAVKRTPENREIASIKALEYHANKRATLGLPPLTEGEKSRNARRAAATKRWNQKHQTQITP